jgi:hypothetical protein
VPPLGVVLQYARCAGVTMEMIVNDSLDLPKKLPANAYNQDVLSRPSKSFSSNKKSKAIRRKNKNPR